MKLKATITIEYAFSQEQLALFGYVDKLDEYIIEQEIKAHTLHSLSALGEILDYDDVEHNKGSVSVERIG